LNIFFLLFLFFYEGIVRSTTSLPTAHYVFQIKNFSVLLGMREENCHSSQFEVGGYHWCIFRTPLLSAIVFFFFLIKKMNSFFSMSRKLVLYPNGKKDSNGSGHISLYLAIAATNDLPLDWNVNVHIRFFVFDQIRDKYLSIQGTFAENLV
jgi:hypothetical protein